MSKKDKDDITFWGTEEQARRARRYGHVTTEVHGHWREEQQLREYTLTPDEIYEAVDILKEIERPETVGERVAKWLFG